jgi:hypothetical protein
MKITHSVAEILDQHVTLELDCIDRLYLNLYVPILQQPQGAAYFWRQHRGHQFASSALMAPMSRAFVHRIEAFIEREGVDLVTFCKGQRKDDVAQEYLASFPGEEGVLFVGRAQEKAGVLRTVGRHNPETGQRYAWLAKSTALVNHFYFYCVDRDFGPFFIKFCSYFPYTGKLCLNGHEYLKRQLQRRNVAFEALDNGIAACDAPGQLQSLAATLSPERIDRFARKWLRRLPHAFSRQDRAANFRYEISIWQAEFATTQIFDRPVTGRIFFEQIIRENVDLGRPDHAQLIFARRILRRTPARFRTRIITSGVIPSLHIDFLHSLIKQYFKEGRGLRTETTINNTYDLRIGRKLVNLPDLARRAFQINRRLLGQERVTHDCWLGEDVFSRVLRPLRVDDQRVSALRLDDPRARALLAALLVSRQLPRGFSNRDLRHHIAPLLGLTPEQYNQGKMSYDLRRLRLHGLIQRVPRSHHYRVTDLGSRVAVFLTRAYNRLLQPGLADLPADTPKLPSPLRNALQRVDHAIDSLWTSA